jgi:hypothetical protein
MRWALIVLAGCLPPDPVPPKPVVTVDEDVARLVHTWTIADHLVAERSPISGEDARGLHGRKVAIGAGYQSPWQGSCEEAARTKRERILADVMVDFDLSASDRKAARRFGLTDSLVEYQLACADAKAPPLVIFVAGDRAMTCFGGACYLLQR